MNDCDQNQTQQLDQEPAQESFDAQEGREATFYGMTATYSPDDNKLRLYSSSRLDAGTYARVKAAGFKWAPKQGLFYAPMWTPSRADLLVELCGEIGDEDTSLTDRAEERADRFETYSGNRAQEANAARAGVESIAKRFEFGQPILVGHHSEKRARKDAERIESGMRRAVKMWETSAYWQSRAAGALRNAKYKELPAVRARRIKGLEADKRKHERTISDASTFLKLWQRDGLTLAQALAIANHDRVSMRMPGDEWSTSLWSLLDRGQFTAEEAAQNAIDAHTRQIAWAQRWVSHYDLRLSYERAMLDEAGGTAADKTGPEKGGAAKCWAGPRGGWAYIRKVNKVTVTVEDNWGNGGKNFTRTIPFDKLSAIMTAAEVAAARAAGQLIETDDGTGFFLHIPTPAATDDTTAAAPEANPAPASGAPEAEAFENLREQLKAGVQIVTAPQLFPTPVDLAERMASLAELAPGHAVLEPSAGTGRLLVAIHATEPEASIVAVEIAPQLAAGLTAAHPHVAVHCGDFLQLAADLPRFDRILLNPPFAGGVDVQHVRCAVAMLKPGGVLVALCANGPRQQAQLRPLAEDSGGTWEVLPDGTFKEAGTNVRTALLTVRAG